MSKEVGWDWFSIQLDQPREEFMLYNLHNNTTGQTLSNGTLSRADGPSLRLTSADFTLTPLTYWTSPKSKKKYPATWRMQAPAQGYDLTVEPLVPQQELALRFFHAFTMYYWEGMCRVKGTHNGQPVTGQAYVEITNR